MASIDTLSVAVAVEPAIINAAQEFAQAMNVAHGVCITAIRFDWIDTATIGKPRAAVVSRVTLEVAARATVDAEGLPW